MRHRVPRSSRFPVLAFLIPILFHAGCALAADESPESRAATAVCDEGPLAERWACALDAAASSEGVLWVGWGIERTDTTLIMSDTGTEVPGGRYGTSLSERLGVPPEPGSRRVGFLFALPPAADGEEEIVATRLRTLIAPLNLGDARLIWLGEADHDESVALLESIFSRVRSVEVRTEFGPMVAVHQDADATLPVLREILTGEHPDAVRAEALSWIGYRMEDRRVADLVVEVLRDRPSRLLLDEGLGALDLAGDPSVEIRDLLFELLAEHPDPIGRALVAESIEPLRDPRAVEALVAAASDDPSPGVRMEAVDALSDSRAPGARTALERLAREALDASVRREAADAIED